VVDKKGMYGIDASASAPTPVVGRIEDLPGVSREQLTETQSLSVRLTAMERELKAIHREMSALSKQIKAMSSTISSLNNNINHLKTRI